jgi:ABC-type multidrug transport system ATPase subunit
MSEYAVECNDITKNYGHIHALRSVSLKVKPGEIIGVLGHNGAGKSTFLKIIGTQLTPSRGTACILGKDVERERMEVRRNIGFLGHLSFMYDELTVEENLRFYGQMFEINQEELKKRIEEVIDLVNLDRYRAVEVKKLSHGLRKRSDLARIFLHSPKVIILDEPFSGLDEAAVKLLINSLKSQGENTTILLSSHEFDLVKGTCNRTLIFQNGKVTSDTGGN